MIKRHNLTKNAATPGRGYIKEVYEVAPALSTQPGIKLYVKLFISNLDELTRISVCYRDWEPKTDVTEVHKG